MPYDYDSLEHQLRLAAKSGDRASVAALLEQGVDIHASPPSGMTAVYLALKYEHLDIVRLLLQHGASVSLFAAKTLEQLCFLQENGVMDTPYNQRNYEDQRLLHAFESGSLNWETVQAERRLLHAYEKGTLSWEEVLIARDKLPDPTLTTKTTVQEAEAAHCSTGNPFGYLHKQWEMLKARMQPGDELWDFDNGLHDQLAGRNGYKLVRQGRVIAQVTTMVS